MRWIFLEPPTQTNIENGTEVEYHPTETIVENATIEFNVPESGEDLLDLANAYLYVDMKIVEADETHIARDLVWDLLICFFIHYFSSRCALNDNLQCVSLLSLLENTDKLQ